MTERTCRWLDEWTCGEEVKFGRSQVPYQVAEERWRWVTCPACREENEWDSSKRHRPFRAPETIEAVSCGECGEECDETDMPSRKKPGWWWMDGDGMFYGPFETEAEAQKDLDEYMDWSRL